jgi:hypothetical protein
VQHPQLLTTIWSIPTSSTTTRQRRVFLAFENSELWATEVRFLNDQAEIEYRLGLLDEVATWAEGE